MPCGGCMQKYPGYVRTTTTTRTPTSQPKVPQGPRYIVRSVAVPVKSPQGIAFPLGTKK